MFYVPCPRCGAAVDIPAGAVGPERTDLWNVTRCDECDFAFDYDNVEVQSMPDTTPQA